MKKFIQLPLALLSIALLWASCKGTDPAISPLLQAQNNVLSNGGVWKTDSTRYLITSNIGGMPTVIAADQYAQMDTMEFQPINASKTLQPGYGGLNRGLAIRKHTSAGVTDADTMNWQIAQASVTDQTPRLILFMDPGANEVQFSFTMSEMSSSRIVMTSERDLVLEGQPSHAFYKYILVK